MIQEIGKETEDHWLQRIKKNREQMVRARKRTKAEESPADKEARLVKRRDRRIAQELNAKLKQWLTKHIDSFVPENHTKTLGYPSHGFGWISSPLYGQKSFKKAVKHACNRYERITGYDCGSQEKSNLTYDMEIFH